MPIKFYNTLARKKQIFKPLKDKKVGFYACGPTVYWRAHLGNLRTYIFEDILRRLLEYNGYKVRQIMNITDVEDKIIKKAREERKNIFEITKPYTKIFFDDLKKLNVKKAEVYPKATGHVNEMINLAEKLLRKKIAYKGEDGSIYFNISKFKNYGKLSRLEKRELKIGARVSADEYNKEQARDFVLWKITRSNENFRKIKAEWPSPWGNGRPGWHIECSAMSAKYLNQPFDIHAGAVDLIFPHHENEIAQSEAALGKKFANYWLHGEHLLVNNQKMSKSLGNVFTVKDLERKKISPLAFRYLVLTSHYRSKLNFTWESLAAAQNALNNLISNFQFLISNPGISKKSDSIKSKNYGKKFLTAVNNDLNAPKAISLVWRTIKDKNLSGPAKKRLILKFDKVLGLGLNKIKPLKIPQKIRVLAAEREKFRANQQFIQADLLRKKIEKLGYKLEDAAYGPKIAPARN
ncbi:MAG: Cysteine-tRNA ligase [Candidatus Wolfebacteria bacterium GW2011_GWA2_42_10]|uniref:Cysteine--tRNA ligase n=2 Tax=Candidatus Wolfeibacteriota TaxID=1752735 RepID=A0A0G0XM16_9BACT|nr:MAG: Cysteine-tRNA ligase [Candidatus Wolfebacteria bacterium GW2011_GWB1_41_12]KKS25517.1 MAG: Cysteine-tRNA ligase [Candidatus Wolfebacteria bacterium GW2011_GWA2_42_10]KKT56597.1 MAG: Cysteine-tRNA ligase [Candidatus Wolfebacteria bacterium GW2011_GWA1_44_24]